RVRAAWRGVGGGGGGGPVAVAGVEEAEVMRGGARAPLGVHAVVAVGVHHQPEAAGGGAAELPEPALPAPSARGRIEAALDRGEEREARRHAVLLEDLAQARQVAPPARQALRRMLAEPRVRAEPLLPGVDRCVVEDAEDAKVVG